MAQDKLWFKDFFKFIRAVIKIAVDCWENGEGKFIVSVTDDKDTVQGKIEGGPTWRSSKLEDEEI